MLTEPPRDSENKTVPHDHAGIQHKSNLHRGVTSHHLVEKSGKKRISSMLYQPSTEVNGSMSVDLGQLKIAKGVPANEYLIGRPWLGIVGLTVEDTRKLDFKVGYDPLPDNIFHGGVWGAFRRAQQKSLATAAFWVTAIDGVELHA